MAVIDFFSLDIKNKRVLIREDLNVPITEGTVDSDARILAAIPTIEHAVSAGAQVILMSHLGRPEEGLPIAAQPTFSLRPVADRLQTLTGYTVELVTDYLDGLDGSESDIVMLENVRINLGEKVNEESLSRRLAALCDVYVMDAFATAHRAQASTEGIIRFAPIACAGPLLSAELEALAAVLTKPDRPLVAIVGGSKVSTKLVVLEALGSKVDQLLVGGGIANTFLAATGVAIGKSLCEMDMLDFARDMLKTVDIPLPTDVVVSTDTKGPARVCSVSEIHSDEIILDIGPESTAALNALVSSAGTIIWNGPVGVFEIEQFSSGTKGLADAIAASSAFSMAGGGDTLAAIEKFGVEADLSYISTGGGAFLEFIEGKKLPAVQALQARARASEK
ncbi:MAG: phosphoglycerate kinase [Pseudomonadales bacterium]|nr:phosphoglycerate kinase [Pseudomonadales bacterium]